MSGEERSFASDSCQIVTYFSSLLPPQGFDAVLTDPMVPTGSLIARKLGEFLSHLSHPRSYKYACCLHTFHFSGLPAVNLLRGLPCSLDMSSAGCPSPPSYVPRFFTGYTDRMNFKERTLNTLVSAYWQRSQGGCMQKQTAPLEHKIHRFCINISHSTTPYFTEAVKTPLFTVRVTWLIMFVLNLDFSVITVKTSIVV